MKNHLEEIEIQIVGGGINCWCYGNSIKEMRTVQNKEQCRLMCCEIMENMLFYKIENGELVVCPPKKIFTRA